MAKKFESYSAKLDTALKELPKKTPTQLAAEKKMIEQNAIELAAIGIDRKQIPEFSKYLARFGIDATTILENQALIIAESERVKKTTGNLTTKKVQELVESIV